MIKTSIRFLKLKYLRNLPAGTVLKDISGYCERKACSGPWLVPIKYASVRVRVFKTCQTATKGLTEPRVPPPVRTIFIVQIYYKTGKKSTITLNLGLFGNINQNAYGKQGNGQSGAAVADERQR